MSPAAPAASEWRSLFDGSSLSAWRGYGRPDVPGSWSMENGTLAFRAHSEPEQRGDLMTRDQFDNFELELEWRIAPGANSGIMFRVLEGQPNSWHTGPEIQVLDDDRHADAQTPSHRAGSLYDLVVPPSGVTRPVGEWNQVRLRVCGNRIQHWLNGQQTVDIEIGSEDWNRRFAASKFRDLPFARSPRGHIVLQDHGDQVWYRGIRVRAC